MNAVGRSIAAAAALAGLALATEPAGAQTSVTLFAGYGGTNGIDNATTGGGAEVDRAAAYGVVAGYARDPSRPLELLYRQQATTLVPGDGGAPVDLTIRILHVGGSVFLEGAAGHGFYATGGVGVTHFSPGAGGYAREVKPSLSLGFGYLLPLGTRFALRAEARGYATLVNSSGGFLCAGGCVAVLESDTVTQVEATIGLSARF